MRNTISYPDTLPIVAERERIIEAIRRERVVVIAGDTGSGKSTQLPKMCLEAGRGSKKMIGCTQPRRIAATSVSERVKEELAGQGHLVGYKIRFQDRTGSETKIKFMTDGILLAESQHDRNLKAYDTIIIDEAHERSLNIDFLLGILKKLLKRRRDLKVIITSATIDTEKFSRAFGNAPVIEVSGRTYPVEIRYCPPGEEGSGRDDQDTGYVEQAAAMALELCRREGPGGDMLIFMPTERDIRECVETMNERFRNEGPRLGIKERPPMVLPLFGRLSGADQNRVFRRSGVRKIVVCTNVAETSITVPGIRYVIDTGLARISTYNVRARTTKLPVTAISRASCDQRAGRCGRVGPGICVRLFPEEDYLSRPEYTLPEIVRSSLAEVILRMISLRLGSPAAFPFIDPPSARAVKDGYNLLIELGAIDAGKKLTKRGRIMAQLPLDPCVSRMILAARDRNCLREVTIIAAALSIQDPRVRPAEAAKEADTAHSAFASSVSDFLSYLHLWDHYHTLARRKKSSSALRRFCKKNFLAYQRMREWRDIHEQIWSQLARLGTGTTHHPFLKSSCRTKEAGGEEVYAKGYDAIHQALLSGNLRNIGYRKEKNFYQGGGGKEFMTFPGSVLFNRGGQWIMAAELVETSRLYARTVATIKPEWLEPLAGNLCKYSYSEPHWEKKQGKVIALQKVSLFGLIIEAGRRVNFGPVDPSQAREIFIQSALVEGELGGRFTFFARNRELIARLAGMEDRLRRRDILVDDFLLYEFYDRRLPGEVHDRQGLHRLIKRNGSDDFLVMGEEDIIRESPESDAFADFPKRLHCGELTFPLHYRFMPSTAEDGVSVKIPAHLVDHVDPERFEWLVPGLLLEKITLLLKGLPKAIRRRLIPIPRTAEELLARMKPNEGSLYDQLEALVARFHGIRISRDLWPRDVLPAHLTMRYLLTDSDGRIIAESRRYADLLRRSRSAGGETAPPLQELRDRWERDSVTDWDFAGLPERISVKDKKGRLAGFAFPGLAVEDDRIALRLFGDLRHCRQETTRGLIALYCLGLGKQCRALEKEQAVPRAYWALYEGISSHEEMNQDLRFFAMREIFEAGSGVIPGRESFTGIIDRVRKKGLLPLARQLFEEVVELLRERRAVLDYISETERKCREMTKRTVTLADCERFREMVAELLPGRFLLRLDREEMGRIPRYLKAIRIRLERKANDPGKDAVKQNQLGVHEERLAGIRNRDDITPEQKEIIGQYRMMIEEFKVSLFAQELKTIVPVSAKRLDKKWEEVQRLLVN